MNGQTEKRRGFIIDAAYFALMIAIIVLAAKYLVPWLLPFIIGYAIAMLLRPPVRFLAAHTRASEKFTGCVAAVFAYLLIGILLFLGGAKLVEWGQSLFSGLPSLGSDVIAPALTAVGDFLTKTLGNIFPDAARSSTEALSVTVEDLQGTLLSVSTSAVTALGGITAKIPSFFLAFFFTIMSSLIISMNYQEVTAFLVRQIPQKYRELFFKVKTEALTTIGKYLTACLKIMGVTFIGLAAGLTFLRVENAVLAALGISLFDALPVLGTGGVMIPWSLITLLNGNYPLALGLAILYAIVTLIRNIIEPRIIGGQLGLHPLATLCAIYVGFRLMNVWGMILFPIAVQILVGLKRSGIINPWK